MPINDPVTNKTLGLLNNCVTTSLPISWAPDTRVTMIAAAVDNNNDGNCATKPSPIVNNT